VKRAIDLSARSPWNPEHSTSNTPPRECCSRLKSRRVLRSAIIRGFKRFGFAVLAMASCCLALSGCGYFAVNQAALEASLTLPASVSFGSVFLGQSAHAKVSLVNQGTVPVEITQLTLTGSSFSLSDQATLPVTLAAGATFSLNLLFDPAVTGPATGHLTVASKALDKATSVVDLSGTGATGTPVLSINSTSVSFGSVALNSPATQPLTLPSTGTGPVTVSAATITGNGFAISGASFPLTLNPGQSSTLNVQFNPATSGAASGELTISSNSSINASAVIALSGTGVRHEVDLRWNAPDSPRDPIAGYHVYRSPGGNSSFNRLNSTVDDETTYMDSTVESGQTYDYYVTDIDSSGAESAPSNITSVTIP